MLLLLLAIIILALLGDVAVYRSHAPLTEARARQALAVYTREHPFDFDAFGVYAPSIITHVPALHSDLCLGVSVSPEEYRSYGASVNAHERTYIITRSTRLNRGDFTTFQNRETLGRFERRGWEWIALPPERIIDHAEWGMDKHGRLIPVR
jgi:hypothetical protein